MSDANTERLEDVISDRRDARAIKELLAEIEDCFGCGDTCAVGLYDRLKVIKRAMVDLVGDWGNDLELPDLEIACRRLRFEVVVLVEAVLSGMDSGLTEREAVTMTIVELLQRKGVYSGKLKAAVDSGEIFQMSEDGGHDRRGTRQMGRRSIGPDSASSSSGNVRVAVDDGQRSGRLPGCAGCGPASFE